MKEQRVERHRKTNKSYSIAKREFVRGYSKFRTLTSSSPLLRTPSFDLSRPHSWMSLIGIQNPSTWLISEFLSKPLTIRSRQWCTPFSLLMHVIVFTILICIIKLTEKSTVFHQVDFCERLMYLQCFHYTTTSEVQNKFQDGNSVIEKQKV